MSLSALPAGTLPVYSPRAHSQNTLAIRFPTTLHENALKATHENELKAAIWSSSKLSLFGCELRPGAQHFDFIFIIVGSGPGQSG